MLILVIVYFYFYLKFSKNSIILCDIRTKEKVLERDSPIISCLLFLIAWWLYNLCNILRCIMHQTLTARGASETDGMYNESEAVETDLAESWLVGMVNFQQHYLNSAKNAIN